MLLGIEVTPVIFQQCPSKGSVVEDTITYWLYQYLLAYQ